MMLLNWVHCYYWGLAWGWAEFHASDVSVRGIVRGPSVDWWLHYLAKYVKLKWQIIHLIHSVSFYNYNVHNYFWWMRKLVDHSFLEWASSGLINPLLIVRLCHHEFSRNWGFEENFSKHFERSLISWWSLINLPYFDHPRLMTGTSC